MVCPNCNYNGDKFASIKTFCINEDDRAYICPECKKRFTRGESKKTLRTTATITPGQTSCPSALRGH